MAASGIWRIFPNIRSKERSRFAYFAWVALLFNLAQTVGLAGSEALFLAELGAGKLPLALVISSAAAVGASTLYASLVGRQKNDRLFVGILLIGTAGILLMLATLPIVAMRYGLFAAVFVLQAVGLTHFRTFATDYFDTLASKRVFPLLAMAASCGGAIGGGLAALVPWLTDSGWLIVGWAIGLACTAIWIFLGRKRLQHWMPDGGEEDAPETRRLRGALRWLRRNRLERGLALSVASMVVAMSILHFVSSALLVESFPSAESLAAFLGIYLAISNIVEILIARWVTPWMLQRVGVPGVQLVHPGLTAVAFLAVGIAPGLGTAIVARANRELVENAFAGEVRNLSYNALPARLRASVRALVEGGVFYASLSLGGLTLLLFAESVPMSWLAAIGFAVAGFYGITAWNVGTSYLARVRAALREGRLEIEGLEDIVGKPELVELASEWESIVETSSGGMISPAILDLASLLSRAGYDSLVARAVTHPDPRLRIACIQALADCNSAETGSSIVVALDDDDVGVREAAAKALRSFGDDLPERLTEAARRHADDVAPAVRAELALSLGGQGEALLSRQAQSADSGAAVEAIARLPVQQLRILEQRIEDPHPLIRAAALTRMSKLAETERLADIDLTSMLDHSEPRLRSAAIQILARRPYKAAAESVAGFLSDPVAEVRAVATSSLIELGTIGEESAYRVGTTASTHAAEAAFDVLAALGTQGSQILRRLLRVRVERAWRIQLAIQDRSVRDGLADRFFHLALGNRFVQDLVAAFGILARLESPATMRHIELGLRQASVKSRTDALELLSYLGDRQATAALVLLIEDGSLSDKLPQLGGWLRLDHGLDAIRSIGHECGDPWLEMAMESEGDDAAPQRPEEIEFMERLLGLRGIPLFTHLSLDQLSAIARHTEVSTYLEGEIVVNEGEPGNTLYALLEGEVDAILGHGTSEEQIVNHLSAPDGFGELSILDGSPRSATILARSDIRLLKLDGPILHEILTDVPQMAIDMLRALSKRVRAADARTKELLRERSARLGSKD